MMARTAKILLLAMALTALCTTMAFAAKGGSALTGHAFVSVGGADANGDWDLSYKDEITGAKRGFDLSGALKYGVQADFNLKSGRGSYLPFNVVFGAYATDVSKKGFSSVPLPGDHFLTTNTKAHAKTIELDLGAKIYGDDEWQSFVPFAGLGAALVNIDYGLDKATTLVKLNTQTNLYDPVSSDSSSEGKKGTILGVWGSAGLLWKFLNRFEAGVEAKYLHGLTKLGGKSLDSLEFALLAGLRF